MKINFSAGIACAAGLVLASGAVNADNGKHKGDLNWAKHIVVIYMENHSFDNLYGKWEPVNGKSINGINKADQAHTLQISQAGDIYSCLFQNDPVLNSMAQQSCQNTAPSFSSAFENKPFEIDAYIPNSSVTRDLVHRFYQEQYQLNNGKQNRYVTGSDATGLTMGYYDTTKLPFYKYLHDDDAPKYVLLDNLFQAAFGGSFLNHQWLISAQTPECTDTSNGKCGSAIHSVVDDNGMPNNYSLYSAEISGVKDKALTASCDNAPSGVACGDYAVNTIQPWSQPFAPGTTDASRLPPIINAANIGDRLTSAGIDWAWYSGGWSNAAGNKNEPGWTNGDGPVANQCPDPNTISGATWPYCPDKLFQFHHQAFNYFENYGEGTEARKQHLRDEVEFMDAASNGQLKPVSFVKPIGEENEHPGYASVAAGSNHLVELLKAIDQGPQAENTLVIITYDEFGGAWDHVPPPGQGNTIGTYDKFGPGTRIPAILVSRHFDQSSVDHTQYDTTSILATIERRFGLAPVGIAYGPKGAGRDALVNDFSKAVGTARME